MKFKRIQRRDAGEIFECTMKGKSPLRARSKVDNGEEYASVWVPILLWVIIAKLNKIPAIKGEVLEDREAQLALYTW